jgi:hypothetical protein
MPAPAIGYGPQPNWLSPVDCVGVPRARRGSARLSGTVPARPAGRGRLVLVDDLLVPAALRFLVTGDVARELAAVYGDQVVYPERLMVDRPDDDQRLFPGWPTPVLVISIENQGVCAWGVPLGDPDPPVLVGGDLLDEVGWSARTTEYAPNIEAFVATRRWDQKCLSSQPVLQAQATDIDAETLDLLRRLFDECLPTRGWPGDSQYRFEDRSSKIMLWLAPGQCDWWISSRDKTALREITEPLLHVSDLQHSLWSNDTGGDALLQELRHGA